MNCKIDEDRNLCDSCTKIELTCAREWYSFGENNNINRCKRYSKVKSSKNKWRAKEGEEYYSFIYEDENEKIKKYKSNKRIEKGSHIDDTYHEFGNYFKTEEECIKHYKTI